MKSEKPANKSSDIFAHTIQIVAPVFALLIGSIVLIGWYSGNKTLIQILPELVAMQYNTALGFVLCGAGMLFCFLRRELVLFCGIALFLLGSLTFSQYIFGYNLGLDELFMKSYVLVKISHPGRMAPNTAICFLFAGIALILRKETRQMEARSLTIALLGSVITALATVALMGYLTGVPTDFGWGQFSLMAFHTAIGFIFVGIGLIALVISEYKDDLNNNLYWLPLMIFVAGITCTLELVASPECPGTKQY